jgi:transcriptional regulator with XRE-family HTH domain
MVSGRTPDWGRRRRVVELRSRGLTLQEIGRRLGVSHQNVSALLRAVAREGYRPLACAACGRTVTPAGVLTREREAAWCRHCLDLSPQVTFGQRLRALRLASGLNRTELARRAGLSSGLVWGYEADNYRPPPANRAKLARALGVDLARLQGPWFFPDELPYEPIGTQESGI